MEPNATLILAGTGEGKTSLLVYLTKKAYHESGRFRKRRCIEMLTRLNKDRETPFELPEDPPIYTDVNSLKVKFKVGYNKWFEPYALNPYYMGINHPKLDTQYVLPWSMIVIPEVQVYGDSRKGTSFPRALSRVFEIRRHFHLEIFMDGHRGSFIDLKIRGMCNRIIDLVKQEHDYDELGRIIRTHWYCKEYKNYDKYEEGIDYVETEYVNEGNIFKYFDSFGCAREFVPPEGVQFSMHKAMTYAEAKAKLPPKEAQFFDQREPADFRAAK